MINMIFIFSDSDIYYVPTYSERRERKFRCPDCPKAYVHRTNLKRHMQLQCAKPARYKCTQCDFCSYYKRELQFHIKTDHTDQIIMTLESPML